MVLRYDVSEGGGKSSLRVVADRIVEMMVEDGLPMPENVTVRDDLDLMAGGEGEA